MVWFQDESPYIDDSPGAGPAAVHAGWLERGHRFSRGPIDRDVLDRLAAICIGWNETESQRRERARLRHRGTHDCSLCWTGRGWTRWQLVVDEGEIDAPRDPRKRETLGSEVIAIEAADRGYRLPNLMLHYVVHHDYQPPAPLIEALRAHPETLSGYDWRLVRKVERRSGWLDEVRLRWAARKRARVEGTLAEAEARRPDPAAPASGERADRICLWRDCGRRASRGMFVCARHARPDRMSRAGEP